jgi:hypothetical protein
VDPSTLIDPALDVWAWSSAALLLVLLGARAWAVETARGRPGRIATSVRLLTIGSVAALGLLVVMLVVQGGDLLAQAVITGEDPFAVPEDVPPPADG